MTAHISCGKLFVDGIQCRPVEAMTQHECEKERKAWREYQGGFDLPIVSSRLLMLERRMLQGGKK